MEPAPNENKPGTAPVTEPAPLPAPLPVPESDSGTGKSTGTGTVAAPVTELPPTWPQVLMRRLFLSLLVAALLAAVGLGGYMAYRYVWAWHHYRRAEKAITDYKLEEGLAHLELCLSVWKNSA